MTPVTHHTSSLKRRGLPVNARWAQEWSQRSLLNADNFVWAPGLLCHCMCVRGKVVIAATNPPPQSFSGHLENWKSHFITKESNEWELHGVGWQCRLNYGAGLQPCVLWPAVLTHLEPQWKAILKKLYIYCQIIQAWTLFGILYVGWQKGNGLISKYISDESAFEGKWRQCMVGIKQLWYRSLILKWNKLIWFDSVGVQFDSLRSKRVCRN